MDGVPTDETHVVGVGVAAIENENPFLFSSGTPGLPSFLRLPMMTARSDRFTCTILSSVAGYQSIVPAADDKDEPVLLTEIHHSSSGTLTHYVVNPLLLEIQENFMWHRNSSIQQSFIFDISLNTKLKKSSTYYNWGWPRVNIVR